MPLTPFPRASGITEPTAAQFWTTMDVMTAFINTLETRIATLEAALGVSSAPRTPAGPTDTNPSGQLPTTPPLRFPSLPPPPESGPPISTAPPPPGAGIPEDPLNPPPNQIKQE